jgi:small subunit ribosomal protein S11
MAKATAKRKVIVESTGEAHISATFNNIIFDKQKGEVISWSSAGKWVLEVLKKNIHTQPKWQQKIVVVVKQDLKK